MEILTKKFIFVTRFFYPAFTGIPRIVSELAFSLADKGHAVEVLTSRQGYEKTYSNLSRKEVISGVKITRISALSFKRESLIGRVINYLFFYCNCLLRLLNLKRNEIVLVLSEPPLISTVATIAIKLRGAKLINWVQDIHPEISQHLGISFTQGWKGRILRDLRNIGWRHAVFNVVIGKHMAEFLLKQGIKSNQIGIYPNWEDGNLIVPCPQEENGLRKQWGLENKFVVGYSGNLGRAHDFTTILETATYFSKQKGFEDIFFLFIGDGFYKNYLEREVVHRGLQNVLFKDFQPREKLKDSLNVPDLHLISALPSMEGLLVPGKLTSALAVGRPVLFVGHKEGEVAQILHSASCGMAISIGDSPALNNAILKLRNDAALRYQWGLNARNEFDKTFDKSVAMSKLCDFLVSL